MTGKTKRDSHRSTAMHALMMIVSDVVQMRTMRAKKADAGPTYDKHSHISSLVEEGQIVNMRFSWSAMANFFLDLCNKPHFAQIHIPVDWSTQGNGSTVVFHPMSL